jgi:hypothetical protein
MTLKGPFGTGQDDALSTGHGSDRVMVASGCAHACTAPQRHPVTISAGPHMPLPRIDDAVVMLTARTQGTRRHRRIIPYPERRNVVIISRVTGLALTAAPPDEAGQPGWG